MKTLIAEDDLTSRLLLKALLAPCGPCDTACNGMEAVRAFGQALSGGAPYDLVCLDIMMPEMDGQTALIEMRRAEERRGIRSTCGATILMTTALQDAGNVVDAFYGLCDGYLVKPIDPAALRKALAEFDLCSGGPSAATDIVLD